MIEKLHRIEALLAVAGTQGERTAAANALERMRARLYLLHETDPPLEQLETSVQMQFDIGEGMK